MIDERTEELASAYVLGALDAEEAQAVEARLRDDAQLRALIAQLREATQLLAGSYPAVQPPAALRDKLLASARPARQAPARPMPPSRGWTASRVSWALAACLAVACVALGWHARTLQQQLQAQRQELAMLDMLNVALRAQDATLRQSVSRLQQSNLAANLRIAVLRSQLRAAPQALAVSVWNETRQSGVILLRDLKPAPAGKDYQLWIIDPTYRNPVSAGVLHVDASGDSRIDFTATQPIKDAKTFAITEEMQGGAPVPTLKAMVLAGT